MLSIFLVYGVVESVALLPWSRQKRFYLAKSHFHHVMQFCMSYEDLEELIKLRGQAISDDEMMEMIPGVV